MWALTLLTASAAQEGDFTYVDNGAGITITGYTGSGGAVTIPNSIGGTRVTGVGDSAFSRRADLTSVTIPESVTYIDRAAFLGCTGLNNVTIPHGLTDIGNEAFEQCTGLTSVTLPNSLSSISPRVFQDCSGLTSVSIPNSVTTIGFMAFFGCTGLTSVTIGKGVTDIQLNDAFAHCPSLVSITVDLLNPAYSSLEGVQFNKSHTVLIQYPEAKVADYVIPESVKTVVSPAFSGSGLRSVTINNSLTSVGGFSGCTGLTRVTIGSAVTEIEPSAFEGCTGLTSLTMPETVTTIGDQAFYGCTGLTSVSIPNRVTDIGFYAFYGCSGLTSLTIGNSVTRIGSVAFQGCTGLTKVTIPDSVAGIGISTFRGCTGLTTLTIGNGLTDIQDSSFSGCTGLKSVYFLGNAPRVGHDAWAAEWPLAFSESVNATVFYRAGTTGWAETFEGCPTVLWVATDDLDQDGMNNLEEMLAGTDPLDASSLVAFDHVARPDELADEDKTPISAAQHALYFQSIPGMRYEILSSETLAGPWTPAATLSATTSQKRALVDKPPRAGFYRIQVLPQE